MGWVRCDDTKDTYDHEGYVTATVKDGWHHWRHLGMESNHSKDDLTIPLDADGHKVHWEIQIACTCGWTSQRMIPPLSADWMPYSVILTEADDDIAYQIWSTQHATSSPPVEHPAPSANTATNSQKPGHHDNLAQTFTTRPFPQPRHTPKVSQNRQRQRNRQTNR